MSFCVFRFLFPAYHRIVRLGQRETEHGKQFSLYPGLTLPRGNQ